MKMGKLLRNHEVFILDHTAEGRSTLFTSKKLRTILRLVRLRFESDVFSLGDPFKEAPIAVGRFTVKDGHLKAGHDKVFKPAKTVPEKVKASYEHVTELVDVKKKIRDEEGKVIIAPPNIKTNPPKRGTQYKNTTFSPIPSFMPDDYNYPRIVARKEFEAAKLLL